jgi:acetylornithine deacetylase/succinyl-diaminopimelate desuccinylase-like protein
MLQAHVQQSSTLGITALVAISFGMAFVQTAPGYARTSAPSAPLASSRIPPDHLSHYSDLAVEWLQQYLRIDTTNPPGNELQAANFFKKILDSEGIENRVFEYQAGRADFWARIPHTGTHTKRPLVLLNHMDVVTSDATHWRVPPFSGLMLDGSIYGRGAQDMKNEGIAQLVVMVTLKHESVALDRDVIFLAVSDE